MTDENETPAPPPPAPADPPAGGDLHDQAHGRTDSELQQLRDRLDDVEAVAYATVMMVLDGDEDAPPETTTIEPRADAPKADDKKPDDEQPKQQQPAESRHSGLFA